MSRSAPIPTTPAPVPSLVAGDLEPVWLDDSARHTLAPDGGPGHRHVLGTAVVAVLLVLLVPPIGAQLSAPAGPTLVPTASGTAAVLALPGSLALWGGPDVQERQAGLSYAQCTAP
jgi:hypothetical protein